MKKITLAIVMLIAFVLSVPPQPIGLTVAQAQPPEVQFTFRCEEVIPQTCFIDPNKICLLCAPLDTESLMAYRGFCAQGCGNNPSIVSVDTEIVPECNIVCDY
jgi:hypothetical protein